MTRPYDDNFEKVETTRSDDKKTRRMTQLSLRYRGGGRAIAINSFQFLTSTTEPWAAHGVNVRARACGSRARESLVAADRASTGDAEGWHRLLLFSHFFAGKGSDWVGERFSRRYSASFPP